MDEGNVRVGKGERRGDSAKVAGSRGMVDVCKTWVLSEMLVRNNLLPWWSSAHGACKELRAREIIVYIFPTLLRSSGDFPTQ